MSAAKLRTQCLASPANTSLITCHEDDQPGRPRLATTWDYEGGKHPIQFQLAHLVHPTRQEMSAGSPNLSSARITAAEASPPSSSAASSETITPHLDSLPLILQHAWPCVKLLVRADHPINVQLNVHARTGTSVQHIDLQFIKSHAALVLRASPVDYIKSAQLRGTLFEQNPADSTAISSAFTAFYVDHKEPSDVLEGYKGLWPLGALLDGHEFLVLVKV